MESIEKPRSRASKEDKLLEEQIGTRLRFFRVAKGVSQTELGNAVGLTFQQIQKYEKGANRISISRLIRFSKILEFDITEFFVGLGGDDTPKASKTDEFFALMSSQTAISLLEDFSSIEDGKLRRQIADLVKIIKIDQVK